MNRYYVLGENTFIEIDSEDNVCYYRLKKDKFQFRQSVEVRVLELAEQTNKWNFEKELNNRLKFYNKYFE